MRERKDTSLSGHAELEGGFSNAAANSKVGMGEPSRQDLMPLNHFAYRI